MADQNRKQIRYFLQQWGRKRKKEGVSDCHESDRAYEDIMRKKNMKSKEPDQ